MTADRDQLAAALPAYDIGEQLGHGAYGVVYAGMHRQLGRAVAIKQLVTVVDDPGAGPRFQAEARVLASMDHPHIVPIYDFVEGDGLCLLVMERLLGGTLWDRMTTGVTDRFACAAALAVAAGLEYAHHRKVLHRDIKPDNLMFSADGVLKVTDFGIAKVVGGATSTATRAGVAVGTPAYMAPEQALGQSLSAATDVYALGTVLYEMLAGQLPYPAATDPVSSLYQHVHEEPVPIGEVSPTLPRPIASVVERAIARSLDERFPTAAALQAALGEAVVRAWGPGWASAPVIPVHDIGTLMGPMVTGDVSTSSPPSPISVAPAAPETVTAPAAATAAAPARGEPGGAASGGSGARFTRPMTAPSAETDRPAMSQADERSGPSRKALVIGAVAAAAIVVAAIVGFVATRSSGNKEVVAPPAATNPPGTAAAAAVLARFPQASCADPTTGASVGRATDFFALSGRGVTICEGSSGGLSLDLPACSAPACTPLLLAARDVQGQYRTVPDASGHVHVIDGAAYSTLDATGAVVDSVLVVDSSRPPGPPNVDLLVALEEYVTISSEARALTQTLSQGISDCSLSPAAAISDVEQLNTTRGALTAAVRHVSLAHGNTPVPYKSFVAATQDSSQADLAWARWIKAQWAPYGQNGCNGPLARQGDPDWDSFTELSATATQDKTKFLGAFNPEAAAHGLRSDWTPDHI